MKSETITAIATPPGKGGIAIVRISGPDTLEIAKKILGKKPQARKASFHIFKDRMGEAIDEGIVLFFPQPNSFTGEDVLELHGHGGTAVINLLLREVIHWGARLAKPGEFSERAFLNNKIDLTQAEAIADLIHASSEQAARASLRSLQGEFSKKIQVLLDALIQLRMYVEAAIDFTDEEIDFLNNQQVSSSLHSLINEVNQIIYSAKQGSLLREGATLVIAGKPNVGKSSLLNALSGNEIAIVTSIPGTTRDILKESIHLDGLPLHIIDTAGLRHSLDPIEQEGIRRAKQEIKKADLILYIKDDSTGEEESILPSDDIPILYLHNKIDLTLKKPSVFNTNGKQGILISVKLNQGLDLLKEEIKKIIGFQHSESTFSARQRHLDALQRTKMNLENGVQQLDQRANELLAEDLLQAQLALNEITGNFTTDDLLGKIFSNFCIGK